MIKPAVKLGARAYLMILSNPDLDCPEDIVCPLKAENEGNIEKFEKLDPRLT